MKSAYAILIVGVLFVLSLLVLERYQVVTALQGRSVYRIDRWTGRIRLYGPDGWREVEQHVEAKPEEYTKEELEQLLAPKPFTDAELDALAKGKTERK
jgi:hypothetical protein